MHQRDTRKCEREAFGAEGFAWARPTNQDQNHKTPPDSQEPAPLGYQEGVVNITQLLDSLAVAQRPSERERHAENTRVLRGSP